MAERFGKYILVEKIAEGGMGEVFLARQRGIAEVERMVVLKRIRPSLRENEAFEELFLSEARISARLNHPNVVQLYEFGRIDESYFLTFERVRGANLADLRRQMPSPWPVEVVFELASQLLAGLTHVHRLQDFDGRPLGIVHRDVSPPNVMVSHEGTAKLLDFGVARSARDPRDPQGTIHGKFPYLSPEQCSFQPLDGRSDLFSLGSVLYELLTGDKPFARPTESETIGAVLFYQVAPPSQKNPSLPPVVDEVLLKALSKQPEQRFESADAMVGVLDQVATTLGLSRGPRLLARYMEQLGRGTPEGSAPRAISPPLPPTQVSTPNMLLVDDDEDNIEALRRTFRTRYNLFTTTDPREAVKILNDNVIHVVITDQRMPHLTGVELLAHATKKHPGVLKVITSALSDGPTLLDAINLCQIHRYVVKPWQPDELRKTVEQLVAEKGLAGPGTVSRRLEQEKERLAEWNAIEDTSEERLASPRARRLRPELLRAVEAGGRVGLLLVGLQTPDVELAAQLSQALSAQVRGDDAVVQVSDEKVGLVLGDHTDDPLDSKLARFASSAAEQLEVWGSPAPVTAATVLPDDSSDVDEALMRVATALVMQKKLGRTA